MAPEYTVTTICAVLEVSVSSYYYWLRSGRKQEEKTLRLYQKIIEVYAEVKGIYGAPRICVILREDKGINVSVPTVSRAMHRLGLRSIVSEAFPQKKTWLNEEEKLLIVNLIRGLKIRRLNQVWTTDITYIRTVHDGNLYLITFLDLFSRRIVAWGLRRRQTAADVLDVLKIAVKSRRPGPGLIIHSDKGSQMRSALFREYLSRHGMAASYTSLDHSCDENPAQESFHASLKKECIYQRRLLDYADAYEVIRGYIDGFYNSKRIHSALSYRSPLTFEASYSNFE